MAAGMGGMGSARLIRASGYLVTRASAAPSGGGVLTDSVLSSGVIVASPEELAVNMLLAAWYW
jgi:hypothetical protein